MIEQFNKLLQETAEANYETELMNDEALHDRLYKDMSLNLIYGQLKLFKYFAIKLCIKYLENNLNEKDYEIIKFYSNLNIDRKYVDHVWKVLDYDLVMQIRQLFDNINCTDEKFVNMFDNIKYQANKKVNKPKVLSAEHKQRIGAAHKGKKRGPVSEEQKAKQREKIRAVMLNNPLFGSKGMHWFNNGISSVLTYECPEGYVHGRLRFK